MCGRYTLHTSPQRLMERFGIQQALDLKPRFNIAPSQSIAIVREVVGGRELAMLRWGLVPSWAREAKAGYSMINARAETVATKPAFRTAFRHRRCLIPADGFYEWQSGPHGKQPYYIQLNDGDVFAFAGLWEHWQGGDDQIIESCTIIVTTANERLRPIHDRMPVILDAEHYSQWLDVGNAKVDRLEGLLMPYPADRMKAYPVDTYVNSPRNDDRHCIAPVAR